MTRYSLVQSAKSGLSKAYRKYHKRIKQGHNSYSARAYLSNARRTYNKKVA